MLLFLLQALWFIAPAYVANGSPPAIRGKKPLDFGRRLGRNRLLGDGKTFEGTAGGILAGIFIGWLQMSYQSHLPPGLGLAAMTWPLVMALSAGAIAGDIIGAFMKRRLSIKRGDPVILLDQLDFLAVSLLAAGFFYLPETAVLVALFILTPPIHWATNYIAYRAKIKQTPW